MKFLDYILAILFVAIAGYGVYNYFNPKVITKIEYVKGETIIEKDTVTISDSTQFYIFKARIDSIKNIQFVGIKDSIFIHDTVSIYYTSNFALGTSNIGCKGNVSFINDNFLFSDVKFNYIEQNTIRVDKVKINVQDIPLFSYSIQIGLGYGIINKNIDLYFGYGLNINLNKIFVSKR